MKSRIKKYQKGIYVALVIFFLLLTSGCDVGHTHLSVADYPVAVSPVVQNREVTSSTMDFVEVWRIETGNPNFLTFFTSNDRPPFVDDDIVIMSYFIDIDKSSSDASLTAFSVDTGAVLWERRYRGDYSTVLTSTYHDRERNRLYLMYSYRVTAFDTKTGELLWISDNLGERVSYAFSYTQGETLKIDSSQKELIVLNPDTGQEISREEQLVATMALPSSNLKFANLNLDPNASDISSTSRLVGSFAALSPSGEILWNIPYTAEKWPVINKDTLIFQIDIIRQIWCVDYQTGNTRWRTPISMVSNFALLDQRVIALRDDGYLESRDAETGALLGYMVFDKDKDIKENFGQHPFIVKAQEPYLFVYFGDSQELIIFKRQVQ